MPDSLTVHILSHTHWDREWYLNSPYTNRWLVPFFDSLFKMLAKEPAYRFILDGQTSMIEDWQHQLELDGIDPGPRLQLLSQYAREGRVCIGPYYLQPDWQLVSEEALVRNLLIGLQMSESLGKRMSAGWLLDNFGQISQTAQIHREFGLEGLFVWRGVEMDPREIKSEFIWAAPDGSQVTAVYLVGSYRNGMRLAEFADSMAARIKAEVQKLSPFATTRNILLMNGYDQEMLPDDVLPMLPELQKHLPGVKVIQSTPEEYLKAVTDPNLSHPKPILHGALYSGRYISVFPGILSSRMYLKIQNDLCQRVLETQVEPLCGLLWGLGVPYPARELDRAWRLLLKNHPHDSICGVSIDDVHADMEARFGQCEHIARSLVAGQMKSLYDLVDTSAPPRALKRWIVVNTGLKNRGGLLEVVAQFPQKVAFENQIGTRLTAQAFGNGRYVVHLPALPAMGYQTIYALDETSPLHSPPTEPSELATSCGWLCVHPQQNCVENAYFKLTVASDGTLDLEDKVNGSHYKGLATFDDRGDAGDTYNASAPKVDRVVTSHACKAEITFIESGPLRARILIRINLAIPVELSSDRESRDDRLTWLPIETLVTVEAHSPIIRFRTNVLNTARDHRLRVLFPTGIETKVSQAATQFDVVTRPIHPVRYDDSTIPENVKRVIIGAREPEPVTIFPQRAFVDISDGRRGLAVLNQGLPEYEILPEQNTIALTLFRSVGWIARPDLLSRIGDAGPLIAVPEAQCLRKMEFHYALSAHTGDWQEGQLVQQATDFNSSWLAAEVDAHDGVLPSSGCYLSLEDPDNQLVVTAVKRAESGCGLILRLFNPTNEVISAKIKSAFVLNGAWYTNLAEVDLQPVVQDDEHSIQILAGAKKIITIRLDLIPQALAGAGGQCKLVSSGQLQETSTSMDKSALPPAIRPVDIALEESRANQLEVLLADKENRLSDYIEHGIPEDGAGLLQYYQLRLDAASYRRTALEARLSEILMKKNLLLGQEYISIHDSQRLVDYESRLRQIGDAINTARVEKRGLEYVVDSFSEHILPPGK